MDRKIRGRRGKQRRSTTEGKKTIENEGSGRDNKDPERKRKIRGKRMEYMKRKTRRWKRK